MRDLPAHSPALRPRRCLHCGGVKTIVLEIGSGKAPRHVCLLPECLLAEQQHAGQAQARPLPALQARQAGQ